MQRCGPERRNDFRPWRCLVQFAFCCLLLGARDEFARAGEPDTVDLQQLRQQLTEQQRVIDQLQRQSETQQEQLNQLLSSDPEAMPAETQPVETQPAAPQSADLPERPPSPADVVPGKPGGLQYGYSDGFFITSPEGVKIGSRDAPFSMKANVRTQLRHSYFDSHGPTRDENDFEFERFFLIFSGNIFTPDLAYHIKFDADSDDAEFVELLDGYATYDIGHALFDCAPLTFGIKGGKWKVPYHRARQESGFNLQFSDRTMASDFFDINRGTGVGLFGRFDCLSRPVNWEAAVFNGFQTQRFLPGRSGELDRNLAVAARVSTDLVGEYGKDGEPDLSFHECPAVRIGAATAHTRVNKQDGLREFTALRVVDTGAPLASVLPGTVNMFDVQLYSIDANFKYRGVSLLSEYYFRNLSRFDGAPIPDLFDHGFMLQAGSFVIREKLELLARWSRVVGDSSTLGTPNTSADEVAGGIAWYIKGHNLKMVFDVTHLNGATVNSTAENIRPRDVGWLFRTQFQLMF